MKKFIFIFLSIISLVIISFLIIISGKNNFDNSSIKKSNFELPLILSDLGDKKINIMYPYKDNMSTNIAYDSLNILSEDRKLKFNIINNNKKILNIDYEIRDKKDNLIQKTKLTYKDLVEQNIDLILDIENLILKNHEYILKIHIEVEDNKEKIVNKNKKVAQNNETKEDTKQDLYYYSRIRAYDSMLFKDMIDLACDFSKRNFDYEEAKKNAIYLETDASEISPDFANVSLKSSFKTLTYNNLNLKQKDNIDIRLLSYDQNIGRVKIRSFASRLDINNEVENYEIEENFTFRKGEERIYILDYHRSMNTIFEAKRYNFSKKRLNFLINAKDNMKYLFGENERYIAFSISKDLFLFDNIKNKLKKVYYNNEVENIFYRYNKYDVKILNLEEDKLKFLVYGYISGGEKSSSLGTAIYEYNIKDNNIKELYFIEDFSSFEELDLDISKLSYLSVDNIFYIKKADNIYSINLNTDELKIEVSNLKESQYAISKDENYFAYIDNNNIVFKNLELSKTNQKKLPDNETYKLEGFVDTDLVLSVADREGDLLIYPKNKAKKLQIINFDFELLKEYFIENKYLDNITIDSAIIKFDILKKEENMAYTYENADSIVLNTSMAKEDKLGYYAQNEHARVYYIQSKKEYNPEKTAIFKSTILENKQKKEYVLTKEQNNNFFVFVRGNLFSIEDDLSKAMKISIAKRAYVNLNAMEVYSKISTPIAAKIKFEADEFDNFSKNKDKLTSFSEFSVSELLYFVAKNKKILAYNSLGEAIIIYAYDKNSISIYNTNTKESEKFDKHILEKEFTFDNNIFFVDLN